MQGIFFIYLSSPQEPVTMRYSYAKLFVVIVCCCASLLPVAVSAQPNIVTGNVPSFFHPDLNAIHNDTALYPLFNRLLQLEQNKTGTLSIVQIGDSHLQDGDIAIAIRKALQQRFGNAGRGLLFPYRVAISNSPADIKSSSDVKWLHNRVIYPHKPIATGISGYAIERPIATGALSMNIENDSFNTLSFFFTRDANSGSATVTASSTGETHTLMIASDTPTQAPVTIPFAQPASEFTIRFSPSYRANEPIAFYGVSAEKNEPGIIYHSIGVNGAQLSQYLQSDLFFEQLPYLHADLYIVSVGTNESDNTSLTQAAFEKVLAKFYSKVQSINPNALLLLTTPASSLHKNKYINKRIPVVRDALVEYANVNGFPYWDLFSISGGNSAWQWRKAGLLSHDGVHYKTAAYQLQGQLFAQAFLAAYEQYVQKK